MNNETELVERIRSEAAIADRPGSLARLEAIADEVGTLITKLRDLRELADGITRDSHCSYLGRDIRFIIDE